ncbi:accessory gene regulator B family protein [Clostridium gasigenes]|uniref:accessory gene regulator B family protein n=1 Tax=Clostridium gasigenes TaxID=94869 RepID=UPI001C0E266B|nr:accessory gene regulator B family protein [Clostridium gasigenes]MBU3130901.1 accessory gene regulator B family protein [Clostridium gasigenes]
MSRKLLKKIIKELALVSGYTKDQEEQVEYTIRVLFFEIIKIILLLFIFKIIGYFNEGLTLLICMVLTKPFIGGYHEKTQIKCFIATLLIASMIIILSIRSKLDFFSIIVLDMISIFIVYNRAPILNDDMPITKLELINKNRRIGITMTILASVISLIVFGIAEYSEIIVWTIFINASLMFNKK